MNAFQGEEASNPKRASPQKQTERNTHDEKKPGNSGIETLKIEDSKKKNKQKVSEMKDSKDVLSDSSDITSEKQHKQSGNVVRDLSEQSAQKSRSSSKRKIIFLVGDSMINGINGNGVSSTHHVSVCPGCPGDCSKDLVDHVKLVVRKKPDLILIHFGTNDVTNGINTEEEMQKAVDHAKNESSETDIVISLCTHRNDKPGLSNKVTKCNEILRNICARNNLNCIENSNIDDSCLGMKKLHLNRKGTSYLANNFKVLK